VNFEATSASRERSVTAPGHIMNALIASVVSYNRSSARQASLRDVNETNASRKSSLTSLEALRMYTASLLHHLQVPHGRARPFKSCVPGDDFARRNAREGSVTRATNSPRSLTTACSTPMPSSYSFCASPTRSVAVSKRRGWTAGSRGGERVYASLVRARAGRRWFARRVRYPSVQASVSDQSQRVCEEEGWV
jgi:hypothetical protein